MGHWVGIALARHPQVAEVVLAVVDAELLARGDVPVGPVYDGPSVPVHAHGGAYVWVAVVVDEPRPVPVVLCRWWWR